MKSMVVITKNRESLLMLSYHFDFDNRYFHGTAIKSPIIIRSARACATDSFQS